MPRTRDWRQLRIRWRVDPGIPRPTDTDYEQARTWPTPSYVQVIAERDGLRFEAEFARAGGEPVVVGVSVRRVRALERAPGTSARAERAAFRRRLREADGFLFAERLRGLSMREIRRAPLDTFLRQAQAVAFYLMSIGRLPERLRSQEPFRTLDMEEIRAELRRARAPRGRPDRGTSFYREIAELYRVLKAQGKAPGPEIARLMRTRQNTVRTWIHRARQHGFLEPVEER